MRKVLLFAGMAMVLLCLGLTSCDKPSEQKEESTTINDGKKDEWEEKKYKSPIAEIEGYWYKSYRVQTISLEGKDDTHPLESANRIYLRCHKAEQRELIDVLWGHQWSGYVRNNRSMSYKNDILTIEWPLRTGLVDTIHYKVAIVKDSPVRYDTLRKEHLLLLQRADLDNGKFVVRDPWNYTKYSDRP